MRIYQIKKHLLRQLSPDLLLPQYYSNHPVGGYCYVVSEAFYHILGGKNSGCKPMHIRHQDVSHWWVQGPQGQIWDLTAHQFTRPVPYDKSKGKGFLTKNPCRRTQELLRRFYENSI